jgi:hypothetical protein
VAGGEEVRRHVSPHRPEADERDPRHGGEHTPGSSEPADTYSWPVGGPVLAAFTGPGYP